MTNIQQLIKKKQELIGVLLTLSPIIAYWIYWTLHPSYWFNADPAATYFLDSLSVFAGGSYKFVDHPGTPLQLIGTFLLALTRPFFANQETFIKFHLVRPSVFFFLTNVFLLTMNVTCIIVFYKTVISTLSRDRILAGVALPILYFGLNTYSFPTLTFWSHNSFNFPIGTLWLLWLFEELKKGEVPNRNKLMLLGLVAGMYAVTQIYFTAWLISGVFIMFVFAVRSNKTIRQSLLAAFWMALGGTLGITLMFIPIYKETPRFAGWLMDNISHQGVYGSGARGFYTLAMLTISIQNWWSSIRPMLLLFIFALVTLAVCLAWTKHAKEKLPASLFALLLGMFALIGMILFVMSKVILRPHFSLSLAATLPLLVLVILKLFENAPWNVDIFKRFFYLTCIAGVLLMLVQQINLQRRRAILATEFPLAKSQALAKLSRQMNVPEADLKVVYALSVPLKCPSLLLASIWEGSFENEITTLCPNQYVILDGAVDLNANFITARPIPDIKDLDWDMVVWPDNRSHLPDYLYSVGGKIIPKSWHVKYGKWFYIHSQVVPE